MGIFGAMTTAVGGLQAQSFALENISGNIANSQTTAFKRTDTSFSDLVSDAALNQQKAGGVIAMSRATNTVQGDIQAASVSTFMAINGNGFFVVQKPSGFPDGAPVFTGNDLYTRRGDFQLDKDGFLVNGSGYYLEGLPIDPVTGNVTGSVPTVLKVSNDFLPAQVTTTIQYRANLAATPITAASAGGGSELLVPGDFNADPTTGGGGVVQGNDVSTFLNESISGGAVTVYDPQGNPVNVQLRWAKTDSAQSGGTDTWNLFYQVDSTATGTTAAWLNAGTDFKFDANGQMNPAVSSVPLTNLTVDGHVVGDVTVNFGSNGVTQFADPNGVAQVNTLSQNGFAAGQLNSISVSDKGRIVASYSNGRTLDIAEVPLVSFNGEDGLKSLDGGAFAATDDSGPAIFGAPGTIVGQSLEGSNTDISNEFTKLITTQQAYAANTRIVTTAQQMLQDTMNMLR
ncbi:MAG TPA: flagellar hook protein FlgE [Xanthobacteraceae bacterium]|nr:flagellar hook protein FlgE [Xanthobacteraceae bacterium]